MLFVFVLLNFSVKPDLTHNTTFAYIMEIYNFSKNCT